MAGLLNQEYMNANPETQEGQVSPEDQEIYEKYVIASIGVILNDPKTFQKLMKAIEASRNDPTTGIARIALSMYEKAENKLGPLDDDEITEAVAEQIIEELIDLSVEAKILTEEQVTEDLAAEIYTKVAQSWIEQNPDRANPEDMAFIQQNKAGQQAPQQPQNAGAQPV